MIFPQGLHLQDPQDPSYHHHHLLHQTLTHCHYPGVVYPLLLMVVHMTNLRRSSDYLHFQYQMLAVHYQILNRSALHVKFCPYMVGMKHKINVIRLYLYTWIIKF